MTQTRRELARQYAFLLVVEVPNIPKVPLVPHPNILHVKIKQIRTSKRIKRRVVSPVIILIECSSNVSIDWTTLQYFAHDAPLLFVFALGVLVLHLFEPFNLFICPRLQLLCVCDFQNVHNIEQVCVDGGQHIEYRSESLC